jgi:hypothetical protein
MLVMLRVSYWNDGWNTDKRDTSKRAADAAATSADAAS